MQPTWHFSHQDVHTWQTSDAGDNGEMVISI
jgi:hypothetical protein